MSAAAKHQRNKQNANRAKQKRKRSTKKNADVTHEYQTDFPTGPIDSGGFQFATESPTMYVTGPKHSVQAAHHNGVPLLHAKRIYKHNKKLPLHQMKSTGDASEDAYGNSVRFHTHNPLEGLSAYRPKLKNTFAF